VFNRDSLLAHLAHHGIIVDLGRQYILGNVCKTVYGAQDQEGNKLIVKIGIDDAGKREISLNKGGYEELRSIGAESLLPTILRYFEFDAIPVIVMSNCGLDFWHATKEARDPDMLYRHLVRHAYKVYKGTRRHTTKSFGVASNLKRLLLKVYGERLAGHVTADLAERLHAWDVRGIPLLEVCFSTFDFTPEDVFVTANTLKYVDPKPGQLGVPILDLACFAGVARDAHKLPGAEAGYDTIRAFALLEVADLLDISKGQAELLFGLGRALQSGLSGYFRLESEPEVAGRMVEAGGTLVRELL